jgi:hypothetical protein
MRLPAGFFMRAARHAEDQILIKQTPMIKFLTARTLAHGSVNYQLTIYHADDGFIGFWKCRNCGIASNTARTTLPRDTAISECEASIRGHHAAKHAEG